MIDINNESGIEADELGLVELSRYALDQLRIHPQADLSIVLVDEETMTQYHERFMDLTGPTDVMSFPMDELRSPADDEEPPMGLLGDIVICPQVAERQAEAAGHDLLQEVTVLQTHGMLHLLGYDHATPDEEAEMFGLQRDLLLSFAMRERSR